MIAPTLRTNLMLLAKAYAKATRTSVGYVSKRFYGQGSFLQDFATGEKCISLKKYDAVIEALKEAWPPDTEWPLMRPAMIDRPKLNGRNSIPTK